MEQRYLTVSKQLIDLGYKYTLQPESLLLVEKLLSDLIETTENLRKYMKVAQDAVEERDTLKFGAEPYRCDNARLVKECNDLHLTVLRVTEQNDKHVRDLKKQIAVLEKEKQDYIDSQKKIRDRVRELELDAVRKAERKNRTGSTPAVVNKTKSGTFQINSAMALADEKIANLMKEIGKFKDNQLHLTEQNYDLKNKLASREKEICRLMGLLQGGRPQEALNNDCCYQNVNMKMQMNADEICHLQKLNADLEAKLKESRCRQHEAMKNALQLAERNNQLEKELRDIDQMALAVEEECNTTVKNNSQKVKRLQDRMQTTVCELKRAEKENVDLKREMQSLMADLEAIRTEKRHLQTVLETTLDDKKRLTDRINKFTIIEKDLNKEIDSLVRTSTEYKRTIAELQGRAFVESYGRKSYQAEDTRLEEGQKSPPVKGQKKSRNEKTKLNDIYAQNLNQAATNDTPLTADSFGNFPREIFLNQHQELNMDPALSVQRIKEIVDDELNRKLLPKAENSLERVRKERDFYMGEYQQLVAQSRNLVSGASEMDNVVACRLKEMDDKIAVLQQENQTLSKEKYNLVSRLENIRDYSDNNDTQTLKSSLKRVERERDLYKADVERFQEERDVANQRVKMSTEFNAAEIERYQKIISDREMQIQKLEQEKYELEKNHGSRRATMSSLEDECILYKQKARECEDNLTQQRTAYAQLKILHEQTDKALADSQAQLMEAEKQLSKHQEKNQLFDTNTTTLNREIAKLRKDSAMLQQSLAEMDQEKDNILLKVDDKTEKIVLLEQENMLKDAKIGQLEVQVGELRGKISSTMDERNSKDYQLKSTSSEITNLKTELQNSIRAKDAAYQENRRLQEELAACTTDNRRCHNDLEIANRKIEDLKTQLQHYVAEVKRIEDLMTQKEVERSEMLDHFRSLSHEATMLESNNHSLENETMQTKLQLSVALDHSTDLEKQLDEQKVMIKGFEREINELTTQLANWEMQVKHYQLQYERAENDLKSSQELCMKLDKQKDDLSKQLRDQQGHKSQVEMDMSRMRKESEVLKRTLEKDHTTVESLENLLAETRQQAVEHRLQNQDLQAEVARLKQQLEEMEGNLLAATERLDVYQEKALEYSQQNKQLRREITNERFSQWRDDQSSSSKNQQIKDMIKLNSVEQYSETNRRNSKKSLQENAAHKIESREFQTTINHAVQTDTTRNKSTTTPSLTILSKISFDERERKEYCTHPQTFKFQSERIEFSNHSGAKTQMNKENVGSTSQEAEPATLYCQPKNCPNYYHQKRAPYCLVRDNAFSDKDAAKK